MKTAEIALQTGRRRGLFDVTAECERFVAGEGYGFLNVFIPHPTAGLVVMELGSDSEEDLLVERRALSVRPRRRPPGSPR